jgi:hypothetical protein
MLGLLGGHALADQAALDIDADDLGGKGLGDGLDVDVAAPRVRVLDPVSVGFGGALQDGLGVDVGMTGDRLGNDGAQLRHVVEGVAEETGGQGAEEAAIVVGHNAQDEAAAARGDVDRWRVRSARHWNAS